jgi:putative endonuclease
MFYVYVLQNSNKQWYTGYTKDLRKRFQQHNAKKSKYTSSRGPYILIYYEACLNEEDAKAREKYLKSGMGKRYLKNRMRCYLSGGNESR